MKGTTRVVEVPCKILIEVDITEYKGTRADLDEEVRLALLEETENQTFDGDGWVSTNVAVNTA